MLLRVRSDSNQVTPALAELFYRQSVSLMNRQNGELTSDEVINSLPLLAHCFCMSTCHLP